MVRIGKGFTLLETLIVVAIIGVIAAIAFVSFQNMNRYAALSVSAEHVETTLLGARSLTLASTEDTVYGVHIGEEQMVRFVGTTYSAGDASNSVISLERGIRATSSLTGGATEIVFNRLTGTTQATGTITVYVADGSASSSIYVRSSGLIESL